MTATTQNRLIVLAIMNRTAASAIQEAAPFIELMLKVSGALEQIRDVADELEALANSQLSQLNQVNEPSSSVSAHTVTSQADSETELPGAHKRSRRRRNDASQ